MKEARKNRKLTKSALKNKKISEPENYFLIVQTEYNMRMENGCYNPSNMEPSGARQPINAINENIQKVLFSLEKIKVDRWFDISHFINMNVAMKIKFETLNMEISLLKDDDLSKNARTEEYFKLLKIWDELYKEVHDHYVKYNSEMFND